MHGANASAGRRAVSAATLMRGAFVGALALAAWQPSGALAQEVTGAAARARYIESPNKALEPPAKPAEGTTQTPQQTPPAQSPPAQSPPEQSSPPPQDVPAPPAAEPPASGQPPAAPAGKAEQTPAGKTGEAPVDAGAAAVEKARAAAEADAAQDEASAAAKAPKRFIPTQKTEADSSATFPVDI